MLHLSGHGLYAEHWQVGVHLRDNQPRRRYQRFGFGGSEKHDGHEPPWELSVGLEDRRLHVLIEPVMLGVMSYADYLNPWIALSRHRNALANGAFAGPVELGEGFVDNGYPRFHTVLIALVEEAPGKKPDAHALEITVHSPHCQCRRRIVVGAELAAVFGNEEQSVVAGERRQRCSGRGAHSW